MTNIAIKGKLEGRVVDWMEKCNAEAFTSAREGLHQGHSR